jgi:exodeoxyribonuclease V gamma subunit
VCFGRGERDEHGVAVRLLSSPPDALAVLRDLVMIYDAGRREPLPLPVQTSYTWAEKRRGGANPVTFARKKWESGDYHPAENADAAPVKLWGEHAPLEVLLTAPRAGEKFDGEDTRLGALAMRLWTPILKAEKAAR